MLGHGCLPAHSFSAAVRAPGRLWASNRDPKDPDFQTPAYPDCREELSPEQRCHPGGMNAPLDPSLAAQLVPGEGTALGGAPGRSWCKSWEVAAPAALLVPLLLMLEPR